MEQFLKNIHVLDRNSYTEPPSSKFVDTTPPPQPAPAPAAANNQLDMTGYEMAALVHHPLYGPSHPNPALGPPPLPTTVIPLENSKTKGSGFGFPLISRMVGSRQRRSGFTVVGSNDTIASGSMTTVGPIKIAPAVADVTDSTTVAVVPGDDDKEESSYEEVPTSPSSSSATATTIETDSTTWAIRRKGKIEETGESFAAAKPAGIEVVESDDEKKHSRGSSATKRTGAADVHNLSETKRRDRMNEKMKALQELIPRCNKSDNVSMLDETIEYIKSLQTQIQMMSMGYGMMYAGMQQQYAPLMGTGMGMGMGMGTDMGMSCPLMAMPYPPAIPCPAAAVPSPGTPRLPIPPYAPCVQPSTAVGSTVNYFAVQIPGMTQIENMANPSRPFLTNRCKCKRYR